MRARRLWGASFRRDDSGQALVEFALVVPIFLLLLLISGRLGRCIVLRLHDHSSDPDVVHLCRGVYSETPEAWFPRH